MTRGQPGDSAKSTRADALEAGVYSGMTSQASDAMLSRFRATSGSVRASIAHGRTVKMLRAGDHSRATSPSLEKPAGLEPRRSPWDFSCGAAIFVRAICSTLEGRRDENLRFARRHRSSFPHPAGERQPLQPLRRADPAAGRALQQPQLRNRAYPAAGRILLRQFVRRGIPFASHAQTRRRREGRSCGGDLRNDCNHPSSGGIHDHKLAPHQYIILSLKSIQRRGQVRGYLLERYLLGHCRPDRYGELMVASPRGRGYTGYQRFYFLTLVIRQCERSHILINLTGMLICILRAPTQRWIGVRYEWALAARDALTRLLVAAVM
jgi:hypothetical protein